MNNLRSLPGVSNAPITVNYKPIRAVKLNPVSLSTAILGAGLGVFLGFSSGVFICSVAPLIQMEIYK